MARVLSTFAILAFAANGLRVDDIEDPTGAGTWKEAAQKEQKELAQKVQQAAQNASAKEPTWEDGKAKEIALFNSAKADATYESMTSIADKTAGVAATAASDAEVLTKREEDLEKMRNDKAEAFQTACAARKAAHTALPGAETAAEDAAADTLVRHGELSKAAADTVDAEWAHGRAKVARWQMIGFADEVRTEHASMSKLSQFSDEQLKKATEDEAAFHSMVTEAGDEKQKADAILTEKTTKLRAAEESFNTKSREAMKGAEMKRIVDAKVMAHLVKMGDGLEDGSQALKLHLATEGTEAA